MRTVPGGEGGHLPGVTLASKSPKSGWRQNLFPPLGAPTWVTRGSTLLLAVLTFWTGPYSQLLSGKESYLPRIPGPSEPLGPTCPPKRRDKVQFKTKIEGMAPSLPFHALWTAHICRICGAETKARAACRPEAHLLQGLCPGCSSGQRASPESCPKLCVTGQGQNPPVLDNVRSKPKPDAASPACVSFVQRC